MTEIIVIKWGTHKNIKYTTKNDILSTKSVLIKLLANITE